jgi:hypothetical protein
MVYGVEEFCHWTCLIQNQSTKYEEKIILRQTKKQLKNKLDSIKKEYTWFMELKNFATELASFLVNCPFGLFPASISPLQISMKCLKLASHQSALSRNV